MVNLHIRRMIEVAAYMLYFHSLTVQPLEMVKGDTFESIERGT